MDLQPIKIKEGINLYMLPDAKFKNYIFGIYFYVPLKEETAPAYALLPKLLTGSNAVYPRRALLSKKAEELYGSRVSFGTEKSGEMQVLSFEADAISDRYAGESLFKEVTELLETILLKPSTEQGGFLPSVFEREKEAHREEIRSVINDKRHYALVRCGEEMCKGEPYGIRGAGTEETLDALTPQSIYKLYLEMLSSAKVDIFVTGAFDEEEAKRTAISFGETIGERKAFYPETTKKAAGETRYVEDREEVQQGKLVIGYRTDVDPCGEDAHALTVYNAVFGGGTASKLFNNVREKMSLCYYASSGLEKAKGLMFVQSGIEFDKYSVTLEAVRSQMAEIAKGHISDAEFCGSVQGIINQLRSYKDSPKAQLAYYRSRVPMGLLSDIDTVIENILAVTKEDVQKVSAKIKEDTVYFLNGMGGEGK